MTSAGLRESMVRAGRQSVEDVLLCVGVEGGVAKAPNVVAAAEG